MGARILLLDMFRVPNSKLPLQTLCDDPALGRIRRRPGRPRIARLAPTFDEREYIRAANEACDIAADSDALVRALQERADVADIIQHVRLKIAREAAVLEFQARRQREGGRDPTVIGGRIIEALGKLAALELGRQKLGVDSFDPRSPRVQRLVEILVESIASIASEVLSAHETTKLVAEFRERLVGWEDAVRG